MKAEKPGFFILDEDITNYTAVNSKIQERSKIISMSGTSMLTDTFFIVPCVWPEMLFTSTRICKNLPLKTVCAAGSQSLKV